MLSRKIKLVLLIITSVLVIGYILSLGRHTVSNFLLAGIIAYLAAPVVRALENRKIPGIAAVSLVFVLMFTLGWFLLKYATVSLLAKLNSLRAAAPVYLAKIQLFLKSVQEYLVSAGVPNDAAVSLTDFPLPTEMGFQLATKASTFGLGLFHLVIIPIIAFLMLYYRKEFVASILEMVPAQYREELSEIGVEIDASMRLFLLGQAVIVGVVFVLTYPALLLIGVKYAFISALIAGVLTTIPYIGTFAAILIPIFLAYADGMGVVAVMQIIGVYSLIHCVEGYIIKPYIYKGSMHLHPLLTIFLILFLGEVTGIWGVVLAIPLAAIAKILWQHGRTKYQAR